MKKFLIILACCLSIGILTNLSSTSKASTACSDITINKVEALANEEGCAKVHENGCHAGGKGAISCSIDAADYSCVGGIGGNCSVNCADGYYACCGVECTCIEKKAWK